MKTVNLLLVAIGLSITSFAQKPSITWGDEFKLQKGSTDLEVIMVDPTGAYLQESHMALGTYFVVGATIRKSASLIKVDKNLKEVYRNDFNKELKGQEFVQFLPFEDKLFLISSDYSRRDKTLSLYGAAINKATGELTGEFKEIAIFQKEEKADDIDYKFSYNADTTKIILVSTIAGKERNEYKIQEFDEKLKATARPITLTNEFEAKKYQLQDLIYMNNRKTVLVGRVFDYEEGKKKKAKFLSFTNYNIRIYDEKGKQQVEINTTVDGKWLNSTRVVQEKNNDLVLAALYSNAKKSKTIDGMLVQRIDANTGKIISTSHKEINLSLVSANDDKEDEVVEDESKEEKKERLEDKKKKDDDDEGFSKYMEFRNIFYTPDGGLMILAEKYHHYVITHYSTTNYGTGISMGSGSTSYTYHYDSGDLLMCKIAPKGDIDWMKVVPKDQREAITTSYSTPGGWWIGYQGYFTNRNYPFYSSFAAWQKDDKIMFLFNDKPVNVEVTEIGQRAKRIYYYSKSDCFYMTLDAGSGKITRSKFFSNTDQPTAMPRLGSIIGNDMYMVGKTDRALAKSKLAIGKISIK